MFAVFLEDMKQLTIFMIVGQTILHFGVSKRYEKYVKLILAFMIVAQLVFSIGAYFSSKAAVWKPLSEEEYYEKWEEYAKELENKAISAQTEGEIEDKDIARKDIGLEEDKEEGENNKIIIDKIWIN